MLFMGCNDLRGPLAAAGSDNENCQIHINDKSVAVIARNILILKVITSNGFDPDNTTDLNYIWDVWYNATWPASTCNRFVEDIKCLLNSPSLPMCYDLDDVKKVWATWLSMIQTSTVEEVLADRYADNLWFWTSVA